MTDVQLTGFQNKIRKIDARHKKSARGYVELVERDGLLVPKYSRFRKRRPIRSMLVGLFLLVVGFFAFKAILIGQMGTETYVSKLETFASGTTYADKMGVWLLQPDAMSVMLSSIFSPRG